MPMHPVDQHVGKRLRLRRKILGMSQESLGSAIGVTFQQIQKYERGLNRIGSSRLFEFSRVLSVPVAYFFEAMDPAAMKTASNDHGYAGVAEGEASDFEHEQITSREALELVRAFNRVKDPVIRKRILDLVKTLSAEAAA